MTGNVSFFFFSFFFSRFSEEDVGEKAQKIVRLEAKTANEWTKIFCNVEAFENVGVLQKELISCTDSSSARVFCRLVYFIHVYGPRKRGT